MCGRVTVSELDGISIIIDDWLEFEPSNGNMYKFRLHLEEVIAKRIINPNWHLNQHESHLIDCLHDILAAEDACINLHSPKGIGQRPLFVQDRDVNKVQQNYYTRRRYVPEIANGMSAVSGPRFHRPGSSSSDVNAAETRYVNGGETRHMNGDVGHNRRRHNRNGYNNFNTAYFKVSLDARVLSEHAEFYVIKPGHIQNVEISIRQEKWTFAPQTERKVLRSYNVSTKLLYERVNNALIVNCTQGPYICQSKTSIFTSVSTD